MGEPRARALGSRSRSVEPQRGEMAVAPCRLRPVGAWPHEACFPRARALFYACQVFFLGGCRQPRYGRGLHACGRPGSQAKRGAGARASAITPFRPIDYLLPINSLCSLIHFGSSPTPPLDFSDRLAQTFFLGCIAPARARSSNWLHGGSRRSPPSRPLDTGLDAPLRGMKGVPWKVAQQRRR